MVAPSVDISRVSFIVMREMRAPLMALIAVYSVSVFGMVFIPGPVVDGEVQYMSIFHAFYFMTYTATTTGFGEIPFEFSDAQRFWAIACLYVSVITWLYAIGSIIHLIQNPFFVRALAEWRFAKRVERIVNPYFIICGFGDTGSVLTRGLSDYGMSAVIIDSSEERIKALQLRNYTVAMPGLYADASVPKHLLEAGVMRKNCKFVVAITNNEEANLKISALARSLNPKVGIITMSKVEVFEETLATLGGEVHIVDPFKTYAKVLAAAMHNPGFYALNNWLVRERGASLNKYVNPPLGTWIICGYGRMGHEVNRVLTKYGIKTAVIDPHDSKEEEHIERYIVGRTTARTLSQAGIEHAAGILAGTDDDGHNLGILLNARYFNRKLFTIVRQNRHQNAVAFNASDVDMIMQPSLVTARKILFLLIAPLLKSFFRYLLANEPGRMEEMEQVISELRAKIGHRTPHLITVDFNRERSPAVIKWLDEGKKVLLGDLMSDPRGRHKKLDLIVFVIKSDDKEYILPKEDYEIKEGDQLLFCGTLLAHRLFNATINSEYKLFYIQNGLYLPRGYLARWWLKKTHKKGLDTYNY
ncbi:potassium channel family protein [Methylomarinum vadi]|uniref:potassium channel family protein n=1 Tax=Methylomarinum vadi TaxID=438855 RepID=UPI0006908A25|nr:potassium channel protein [Methylomarinum vadi]